LADRHAAAIRYVLKFREVAFRPGRHDCALFAAGWVAECGGPDLARGFRSKYRSLESGRDRLREMGHEDEVAYAAAHLREVPRLMAQSGDVAVVERAGERGFGIVVGEVIQCLRPDGLGHVRLDEAQRVFRP
jgi:hypothetical protein